jgi:hypothetical protein
MGADLLTADLNWGCTRFDDGESALASVFQMVTLEGWTPIQYMIADAGFTSSSWVFPLLLIVFGSLFVLNLVLAVLYNNFMESSEEVARQNEKRAIESMFQALDENGDEWITADELMRIEEFSQLTEQQLSDLMKAADTNRNGTIDVNEFKAIVEAADFLALQLKKEKQTRRLRRLSTAVGLTSGGKPTMIAKAISLLRHSYNCILGRFLGRVARSTQLENFVFALIFINFFTLALERYNMPAAEVEVLDAINAVLTVCFAMEMAVKLLGLGIREYISDSFNIFDAFVVTISVVELWAYPPPVLTGVMGGSAAGSVGSDGEGYGGLSALRTFRVFRVLRLLHHYPSLRGLIRTIGSMMYRVSAFG